MPRDTSDYTSVPTQTSPLMSLDGRTSDIALSVEQGKSPVALRQALWVNSGSNKCAKLAI